MTKRREPPGAGACAQMSAQHDDGRFRGLDKETFMAWGKLVFGQPWNLDIDPPPDLKESRDFFALGNQSHPLCKTGSPICSTLRVMTDTMESGLSLIWMVERHKNSRQK
jgi:hypothetical protein